MVSIPCRSSESTMASPPVMRGMGTPAFCLNLSAHLEDELALEVPAFAHAERLGGVGQREQRHVRHLHRTAAMQLGDAIHVLAQARHCRAERRDVAALR